uniref:DNA polymerase epsilon subunit 3 n=1 Tax=Graphocephala atropunctata TaxID=36148 RepID=A0A1B6KL86_9HEMI
MAEKPEDLNLPISVVTRLMKENLPDGSAISKDGKTAVARAASVFVLYMTAASNKIALTNKKKTLNYEDIFQALIETEYEWLENPLREALEDFKLSQKRKKDAATKKKLSKDRKTESNTSVGSNETAETGDTGDSDDAEDS